MKRALALLLSISLLVIALTGCADTDGRDSDSSGNESDVDGRITKEAGSVADFVGWWQSKETDEVAPFACIKISTDGVGEVYCYDENGDMIDIGDIDYSEQRAQGGKSLMVSTFSKIGEYGGTPASSTDGERWLNVKVNDKTMTFYYQSESPFQTEKPIDVLSAVLGDKLSGKKLVETGEATIDGAPCKTFSLGTDHSENFDAEEHFAVSPEWGYA